MADQNQLDLIHLRTALDYATLSKAVRKKAGAVLVTNQGIIIPGFNGTPRGVDNNCENIVDGILVTKPIVVHAELNCVLKAAREGVSIIGSTIYTSLSPCESCSAMIIQAGVGRVVYLEEYRITTGIDLLRSANIPVQQLAL